MCTLVFQDSKIEKEYTAKGEKMYFNKALKLEPWQIVTFVITRS